MNSENVPILTLSELKIFVYSIRSSVCGRLWVSLVDIADSILSKIHTAVPDREETSSRIQGCRGSNFDDFRDRRLTCPVNGNSAHSNTLVANMGDDP